MSVTSTSPLNSEQLDASFAQMKEVRAIGRGVGLWGDMVIVLNDGAKIEIRCIDRCVAERRACCNVAACADACAAAVSRLRCSRRWQEIKAYIEAQIAAAESAKEAGYAARRAAKKA